MKEIKQTKSKKCIDWFSSHIVVIAVIAFAIGLFLSSCHYAKAEDYSSDMWALVQSDMDTYMNNNSYNASGCASKYAESQLSLGGTNTISKYLRLVSKDETQVVYFFSSWESEIFNLGTYKYPSREDLHDWRITFGEYSESRGMSLSNISNTRFYVLVITDSGCRLGRCGGNNNSNNIAISIYEDNEYVNTVNFYTNNNYLGNGYWYGNNVSLGAYFDLDNYTCKGDDVYLVYSSNEGIYFPSAPDYVSDTRLQFATWTDALGRSILHVDMTDYLNSTGFNISNTTLNDFTLSIEYDVKNSDDIESHTVSYNNSSEYYVEYGENGRLTKIYMNIPYKEFYGYSYEKNSFPDYDDVIIQNAIINLDLVPVGGNTSINISSYVDCLYYLQHVYSDIVPDVVPDPSYEDTIIYDTTIINDMKTSLHNKTSQYSFISGDWVFIDENNLPTFENWASVFTNYVWFADVNSDTTYAGHWWQMANNIPSVADLSRPFDPSEWIELNKAFAFYDIIVLKVWRCGVHVVAPSPPVVSVDELAGYLVLYSDRYYQHYEVENQLGIIEILQNDATNAVSFYDAIKTRVDDFEEKTLDAITGEDNSLFAYINNLDNDLNSGISRIIDSMPVFNWTPFNDDDILMALYTIVNNQENPKDGYARYIAWVKSESSAENGFKVWADDMFDVFHDVYNFFNYQDDINPNETGLQKYVDYVKLYIQYLTQQTDGISSNEYVYYKGIFDNTYDLHDVNG